MNFDEMWESMIASLIVIIVAAVGFGMLLMWGLPKLWDMVKPWIHLITA
jgi:hypothetical protein